jgi:ubiquinone/menaquinone biosynthesis C-methylase UbiE
LTREWLLTGRVCVNPKAEIKRRESVETATGFPKVAWMSEQPPVFQGSVPENYDRYLGPMFFEPYAADLLTRISVPENGSVLELACGTGIVTRMLRDRLPPSMKLTATDLSEPMMKFAQRKFDANELTVWQQADASSLPFGAESFDAVVCQFGLMFVPDKVQAMREARRVLKPGASFLFNVWAALEQNDFARITHETVGAFFENDPPSFYEIPFGYHDRAAIESALREAGFDDVRCADVSHVGRASSAATAAIGLVEGTPIAQAITERDPAALPRVREAVAEALRTRFGETSIGGNLRALVFQATTPGPAV